MNQPEELQIPVPWGQISCRWWGPRDRQPVLALHGWQDNAGTFDGLAPLLPQTVSLLCIDLPGHGFSSPYPEGQYYYLYWDGVILIRRIVKHFGWATVSLMGHSLGGSISFLYAASFPNEVDKLICIDIASPSIRQVSALVKETGKNVDKFLKYESLNEASPPTYYYDEMLDIVEDGYEGSLTRDSCKIMMRRGIIPVRSDPQSIERYKPGLFYFSRDRKLKVAGMGVLSKELVFEYASKIQCKVLNIKAIPGLHSDNSSSYYVEVLSVMRETARSLDFYQLEGTHHLHLNTPEVVAPYICEFLEPGLNTT